ncbi:MAG: GtrA family protein [Aliishimia sp.]
MQNSGTFTRFAIVGVTVAALYIGLYIAFLGAGLPQFFANGAAFILAIVVQYVGQAGFTFKAELKDGSQIQRFGTMIGLGLITSALVTGAIGPWLNLSDWLSAAVVTIILPLQNYLIMTRWVFKSSTPKTGASTVKHVYNDTFFDYIDSGARSSAQNLIGILSQSLSPSSVLDLGCGRGVWLDEWQRAGAQDVLGVDGDYVNRDELAISQDSFYAGDLTKPLYFKRRFDLAQSLEVGEHLPTSASEALVDSLTQASDRILFSAAVVGQGGEFHVNEQPLSFWQEMFEERGYRAYDCLRPHMKNNRDVEPWYRYNAVFYANEAGQRNLPASIRAHQVREGQSLQNAGDLMWCVRRNIVAQLPQNTVTRIAQARAFMLATRARRGVEFRG